MVFALGFDSAGIQSSRADNAGTISHGVRSSDMTLTLLYPSFQSLCAINYLAMAISTSVSTDGGFLPQERSGFSSPPFTTSSNTATLLPRSRSIPLKPGSTKESNLILYVDQKLLEMSRRYEKRFNLGFEGEPARTTDDLGYGSFDQVAKDLEYVVDVVWVSGTRML